MRFVFLLVFLFVLLCGCNSMQDNEIKMWRVYVITVQCENPVNPNAIGTYYPFYTVEEGKTALDLALAAAIEQFECNPNHTAILFFKEVVLN